jgi:hypothetical protein
MIVARKHLLAGVIGVASLLTAVLLLAGLWANQEEFRLVPQPKVARAQNVSTGNTHVGTGWSISDNPATAVQEALDMALAGAPDESPDFVIAFASAGSDTSALLTAMRQRLGVNAKIYGGTSDSRSVITDKGYVKVQDRGYDIEAKEGRRGLAVMTVRSKEIDFGVGSADFTLYPTAEEAGRAAVLRAMESAGRTPTELPCIVLTSPTIGDEEEVVKGIEQVVGPSVAILGGTLGGPKATAFGVDRPYEQGVSVAVLYTNLPLGWTFEGGFDISDPRTGIATKMEGQAIVEIDGRPALDVYDEWLDGRISQLVADQAPDRIRDLLTLCPIFRRISSPDGKEYQLFSHPWPREATAGDKAIMTSTQIQPGERLYLSRGTWETLLNRVGNLPRNAKANGGFSAATRPVLGIGTICGGVMGVIPESERAKMSSLINHNDNDAPFIANFTWGEQGHFAGVGNRHGNLTCGFLVIGTKD